MEQNNLITRKHHDFYKGNLCRIAAGIYKSEWLHLYGAD